jgi:hypothetical protein
VCVGQVVVVVVVVGAISSVASIEIVVREGS